MEKNHLKKYRLIREYPGSPKLNTILQNELDGYYSQKNIGNTHIRREFIENNPEFWEEIIEKDYEILTLQYKGSFYDKFDGTYWYYMGQVITDVTNRIHRLSQNDKGVYIHSVKRLSDGEVFTINDRAKTITSMGTHNITSFEIKQKQLTRLITDGIDRIWIAWSNDEGGNWLESTEHIKKPLLITDDGIKVFEGDTVWGLYADNLEPFSYELGKSFTQKWNYGIYKTKESAEEAALMYKPCLSINDVINNYHYTPSSIKYRLTGLIKSRI